MQRRGNVFAASCLAASLLGVVVPSGVGASTFGLESEGFSDVLVTAHYEAARGETNRVHYRPAEVRDGSPPAEKEGTDVVTVSDLGAVILPAAGITDPCAYAGFVATCSTLIDQETTNALIELGDAHDTLKLDQSEGVNFRLFDVYAGPGNDTVTTGPRVSGARVVAGPGADVVHSGGLVVEIDVQDGVRDVVWCGPGFERVKADPLDRLNGCGVDDRVVIG